MEYLANGNDAQTPRITLECARSDNPAEGYRPAIVPTANKTVTNCTGSQRRLRLYPSSLALSGNAVNDFDGAPKRGHNSTSLIVLTPLPVCNGAQETTEIRQNPVKKSFTALPFRAPCLGTIKRDGGSSIPTARWVEELLQLVAGCIVAHLLALSYSAQTAPTPPAPASLSRG